MKQRSLRVKLALLVLLIVGCGCSAQQSDDPQTYLIGVCQANGTDELQSSIRRDIKNACDRYNDVTSIFADAGEDPKKQAQDIGDMIERQVDVIIVTVCTWGDVNPSLLHAQRADIPVIIIGDSPEELELYTSHVYVDYYKAGQLAGIQAAKMLDDAGIVLEIQGEPYVARSQELKEGFLNGIAEAPKVIKEHVVTGYWTYSNAKEAVFDSVIAEGQAVDLVFAHNVDMAIGARSAFASVEVSDPPFVIGVGEFPEGYVSGEVDTIICCPTGGGEAVDLAMDIMSGKQYPKSIELFAEIVGGSIE